MDKMIWRCDLVPQYKDYKDKIQKAISSVLNTGVYILGPNVDHFERIFASYIGTKKAVGVANGTDAIVLILKALNISQGDEVLLPVFTAIPTVSAVVLSGATPVFVDIVSETQLIDINKINESITTKTKAIICVHLFGNVVDVEKIKYTCPANISIIEDACQAHGSLIRGKKAGSLGHAAAFSFYPTKNLGGYGDGGIVVTNDEDLAQKIKLLRMYGMVDKDHIKVHGMNSRLDEIQAAILSVKLPHLDDMNRRRQKLVHLYQTELIKGYFDYQQIDQDVFSNYHVFAIRLNEKVIDKRESLIQYLSDQKIQTNIYYPLALHEQEANQYLNIPLDSFPCAKKVTNDILCLPMYAELEESKVLEVILHINRFFEKK